MEVHAVGLRGKPQILPKNGDAIPESRFKESGNSERARRYMEGPGRKRTMVTRVEMHSGLSERSRKKGAEKSNQKGVLQRKK